MTPDVESVCRFRNRRIAETIEDTLILLRSCAQDCFELHGLARAAEQISLCSKAAHARLLADPKVGMWSLVDLLPLVEKSLGEEAAQLATDVADHINYIAIGVAIFDRRAFAASVKPLPNGTFLPICGECPVWPHNCSERVTVRSDCNGTLSVNNSSLPVHRWHFNSGFTLPIGDPLLAPPPLEGYELASVTEDELAKWDNLLSRVSDLVERCRARLLVGSFGSFILPLIESTDGDHLSVSFKHRPAVIYASWSNPLDVFEAVVHEADHQCLYEIINEGQLFTDAHVNQQVVFRSPWRRDARPLSGLFFGLSAFVTVGTAWTRLIEDGAVDPKYGGRRAVLTLEQSLDAISTIADHASLTKKGTQLLEHNKREALASMDTLRMHPAFEKWILESQSRRQSDALIWEQASKSPQLVSA